jgi:hypothetical protein
MERALAEPARRGLLVSDGGENAELLPIIARTIKHLPHVVRILFLRVLTPLVAQQESLGW